MDLDGNGVVEWDEFRTYVTNLQRLAASGIVQTSTDTIDQQDEEEDDFLNGSNGSNGDMATPPGDVLNSSNMPGWAKTNQDNQDTRLPLGSLKNGRSRSMKSKKNSTKNFKNIKKVLALHEKNDQKGLSQHQLIFEDSFQWNRKNFDLPKKKSAKEKEIAALEKKEKRKKQTAVDPSDKAEALEVQVQSLRNAVENQNLKERQKTSGLMRR